MNRINLPQTIQVGGLTITQATNCHVSIRKDGRRVFHAQVDRPMNLDELMECVKMYKTISETYQEEK